MINPVIKWSGSKRSQAQKLVSNFPDFDTYYEPFLGGGSVLYTVLTNKEPSQIIASDICKPLVDLWLLIQEAPERLINSYDKNWNLLQTHGNKFFYDIRKRFNITQSPEDLFFLSRTCVNGLIRFNQSGGFNNSFHHTRNGIKPSRMAKIVNDWSEVISDVKFLCSDYKTVLRTASPNDFVYLDPPYFNTKGRYYGKIDYNDFISELERLNQSDIRYMLSYDGTRADCNYIQNFPKKLFKEHWLLNSGISPFKKVMDQQNQMVLESVYINFESSNPLHL